MNVLLGSKYHKKHSLIKMIKIKEKQKRSEVWLFFIFSIVPLQYISPRSVEAIREEWTGEYKYAILEK